MTKSKKTLKRVKNLTSKWNKKWQHFFPNASRSLLCIRFVAIAFQSEEKVLLRRGPPWPILALPWIRHWADLAENNNTCKEPWVPPPYQVSPKSIKRFWRRNRKCKLSNGRQTDGRQTTDRRTTDAGQRVITIGHWSFRLLCQKNGGKVRPLN